VGVFIVMIVWFLSYWGGMALVIKLDAAKQRTAAKAAGAVDFADRNPVPYMLLGLICGPFPLLFYFGSTRRSAKGWLMGIGIAIGWSLLFGFLFSLIEAYARTHH
jgi:hypothetical protein